MQAPIPRYPDRLDEREFRALAYRYMYLSRRLDERLADLFRRGLVKGTVTLGVGNEATAIGMSFPFRPGKDVISLLHRDVGAHLVMGVSPYDLLCQYMANAESMTHAREGNVHHGNVPERRLPMMSHLGSMLAPTVGAVWAARRRGEDVAGLAIVGDGGTSTGAFHESLNIASVRRVPVLFLIENNSYAFSTPVREQYACRRLADRAVSYGIEGVTVDGTDAWQVYTVVNAAIESMCRERRPMLIESLTLRLTGHAVYDKGDYVTDEERAEWMKREPLALARAALLDRCGLDEASIARLEREIDDEIEVDVARAIAVARPAQATQPAVVFAPRQNLTVPPLKIDMATNQTAVTAALDYILANWPESVVLGLDIAAYGSAFKTCKGLVDRYGPDRVVNMPLAEPAIMGFALGASQTGARPIVEFQFADFVTEAVTQLGLNCGTWYFRSGNAAPLVVRLPCGGGVTLGAFHSGEFEGLVTQFPGLKVLYPTTPQETFEALVAAFHDPNPCIVLEHKLLYTKIRGRIDFDGDIGRIWRARRYREGAAATVVAFGAMVETAVTAAEQSGCDVDVWSPFSMSPLELGPIADSLRRTRRLMVIQEAAGCTGLADRVVSRLCREVQVSLTKPPVALYAPEQPVPFAPELETFHRPDAARVGEAMRGLVGAVP